MANDSFQSSFFKQLDGPITINKSDYVTGFSLIVVDGDCEIQGTGIFQGQDSEAVTLPAGTPYTALANQYSFLDGYTITPNGTTIIDIKK